MPESYGTWPPWLEPALLTTSLTSARFSLVGIRARTTGAYAVDAGGAEEK